MKQNIKLTAIGILLTFSSLAAAAQNTDLQFALGQSGKINESQRSIPLIATSADQGVTWTYPAIHVPSGMETKIEGELTSVACTKGFCVATGDQKSGWFPLAAFSTEPTTSWMYVDLSKIKPQDFAEYDSGGCSRVVCNSETCITGIVYRNTRDHLSKPFFIYTSNGVNWNVSTVTSDEKYKAAGRVYIESMTCSESVCVAFADDLLGGEGYVFTSQDHGKSWSVSQTRVGGMHGHPKVACQADTCIAATGNSSTEGKVFLLRSQNKGKSWDRLPTVSVKPYFDRITSIKNVDGTWMINGDGYINTDVFSKGRRPFVMLSHDEGEHWQEDSSFEKDSSRFANSSFLNTSRISCSNDICMFSLLADDEDHSIIRAVAISMDRGKTWGYLPDNMFPPRSSYASPIGRGQSWFLIGYQYIGVHYKPIVLRSENVGRSWSIPQSIIEKFPADEIGLFYTSA